METELGGLNISIQPSTEGPSESASGDIKWSSFRTRQAIELGTSAKSFSAALDVERPEEGSVMSGKVSWETEAALRNERARANALMDMDCLRLLKLFIKQKSLPVAKLNSQLRQPQDWTKVALLVRADFIETLDSTFRITSDGLTAWKTLHAMSSSSD